MQSVSNAYKYNIRNDLRRHSYMMVTVGVINQLAQRNAFVDSDAFPTHWLSDLDMPFGNTNFEAYYATAEDNFTKTDGSYFFAPRSSPTALSQGAVSKDVMGAVAIDFGGLTYSLRGLTIEFGDCYPESFQIIDSTGKAISITGNDSEHFVYDGVIQNTTSITIKPVKMRGGQDRLRILRFTAGIGIVFDNKSIMDSDMKENVSPLSESLPAIDFKLTVDNRNGDWNIENDKSTINYLENSQTVTSFYGYELDDGTVDWMKGGTFLLSSWSADDEQMKLTAVDRWTKLNDTYYKGKLYPDGITAYDLAILVFKDAGLTEDDYDVDTYLKGIKIYNPLPIVKHSEALQLIANACRCVMYQNRDGKLTIKHSFSAKRLPDMTVSANQEHALSRVEKIAIQSQKTRYALANQDVTLSDGIYKFHPKDSSGILDTGFISSTASDASGNFATDPVVIITLEASYHSYGLHINFGGAAPKAMTIRTMLAGSAVETKSYSISSNVWSTEDELKEFDRMEIEITKGAPESNVYIDSVSFGDVTDYRLEYSHELTDYPTGEKISKVKELTQMIYSYIVSTEAAKELYKETVDVSGLSEITLTFNNASYNYNASIAGKIAKIKESGAHYAVLTIPSGISGTAEVIVNGNEYIVNEKTYRYTINQTGSVVKYDNPLVSTIDLAHDVVEWEGDYNYSDRDYKKLSYRGDPRIDANDILLLENHYIEQCFVRVYQHEIKFNGGLSGSISARRDMPVEHGNFIGAVATLSAQKSNTADKATSAESATSAVKDSEGNVIVDNYVPYSHIQNNLVTTESGYALDARQGKELLDKINSLNSNLTNTRNDLSTHKSSGDHDGRYYTESEVDAKINAINNSINSLNNGLANNYNSINAQLNNGVNYLKWRGYSSNLDWSLSNGIYFYLLGTTSRPSDYGVCLVLNNGNDSYNGSTWIFQLAFSTYGGNIYFRRSINATNGGDFSNWIAI